MFKQKWFRAIFRQRVFTIFLVIVQLAIIIYSLAVRSTISDITSNVLKFISLCVSIYIIIKDDNGSYKLMWVFLILNFPIFGGLMYLLFAFQSSTRRFQKKLHGTQEKVKKLALLPGTGYEKAIAEMPAYTAQINYLQNFAGFPVYTQSRTKYLSPGEAKLESLLSELEKAEKYIFLEYFIIQEGEMWGKVLEVLKRKAAEGVKIKIIYDDMGCFLLLPKDYTKTLLAMGIECAVFNPFRPFLTAKQNNRDHRKIVSIDGKVAFTGGINLADEYINAVEKHGHWKDASIMVEGKAAWSFTLMFLQMWELASGKSEDYAEYYPWQNVGCDIRTDGFVLPYADSPIDKDNVGEQVYLQIINNAKKYIYITTPYLIADEKMLCALSLAAKSGVDVRIITPHKWDKWFVHMTTRSYYRELIKNGVKIYEYTKGFIHSKTFVSDDTVATVGTTNLDFRSLYLHFECGTVIYGSETIEDVKKDFLDTLEICQVITEKDCKCNIFVKSIQDILRIFAPLM
ncbi:MAG: cardiolipin synthase [Clostridia bacterium]|nr:cardiolipin synthase [Clostridia bacterium]